MNIVNNILNFFNLYLLQNKKLIYYLLQNIKDCIPKEYMEKYALQIDCINKIQWVLNIEVDLYFEENKLCKDYKIKEWEREKIIAKAVIVDKNDKIYRFVFYAVNGRIFSIESNLPFRDLLVENIKDLQIFCE